MKLVTNDDDVETEEKLIIPSFVLKSIRTTNEDLMYSTGMYSSNLVSYNASFHNMIWFNLDYHLHVYTICSNNKGDGFP